MLGTIVGVSKESGCWFSSFLLQETMKCSLWFIHSQHRDGKQSLDKFSITKNLLGTRISGRRVEFGPVQSFETQYLNTNYVTFMSIFGLGNHLGDSKVFDGTLDLVERKAKRLIWCTIGMSLKLKHSIWHWKHRIKICCGTVGENQCNYVKVFNPINENKPN